TRASGIEEDQPASVASASRIYIPSGARPGSPTCTRSTENPLVPPVGARRFFMLDWASGTLASRADAGTRPRREVFLLLEKIAHEIAECHRHAAECRDKADQTDDPEMKRDLLALERSWLFLASSYELSERLSGFTGEAERRNKD